MMKRIFSVALCLLCLLSLLSFTGCSPSEKAPAQGIVGTWGGRSDNVEALFDEDGTCIVGGVVGTYEVDEEDNTLTVTPNGGNTYTYSWNDAEDVNSISSDEWGIVNDQIYINGYTYTKQSDDAQTASSAADENNSQAQNNSSENSGNTSSSGANSSSSTDNNSKTDSSSKTDAASSKADSSSKNDSTSSASSSASSSNVDDGLPDIVEYFD